MKTVYLIRHGATAGNLDRRYIGITDEPLCDDGVSQMLKLREEGITADCIFTSPMLRARQSAEIVFPGAEYRVIDGISETDFGVFEGKSAQELCDDERYRMWVESMCTAAIPGGEDIIEFKLRCCRAFEAAMREVPDDGVAAFVTHGGVIMAIMESFASAGSGFYDYHIGNGEYIVLEIE